MVQGVVQGVVQTNRFVTIDSTCVHDEMLNKEYKTKKKKSDKGAESNLI